MLTLCKSAHGTLIQILFFFLFLLLLSTLRLVQISLLELPLADLVFCPFPRSLPLHLLPVREINSVLAKAETRTLCVSFAFQPPDPSWALSGGYV